MTTTVRSCRACACSDCLLASRLPQPMKEDYKPACISARVLRGSSDHVGHRRANSAWCVSTPQRQAEVPHVGAALEDGFTVSTAATELFVAGPWRGGRGSASGSLQRAADRGCRRHGDVDTRRSTSASPFDRHLAPTLAPSPPTLAAAVMQCRRIPAGRRRLVFRPSTTHSVGRGFHQTRYEGAVRLPDAVHVAMAYDATDNPHDRHRGCSRSCLERNRKYGCGGVARGQSTDSDCVVLPGVRQQTGDEAVRQQERAGEGENTTQSRRSLGHTSVQRLQVFSMLLSFRSYISWTRCGTLLEAVRRNSYYSLCRLLCPALIGRRY